MRPKASRVAVTRRSRAPGAVTSVGTASAPGSSPASSSKRSARRAASTTRAPECASRRAVAAPMPDDAPVTMQTASAISMTPL